jgi:putative DNA-invertase from lambdoid prophage Rac
MVVLSQYSVMPTKRVATYVRVSTDEQTTDNQVPEVEELAERRGEVVKRFTETGSAAKVRPGYDAMLKAARKGQFDVLVVWALDRFGRSMVGNINDLLELDRLGVQVVSVRESWLDTDGPTRGLLVAVFSWCAEQERARLIERTKAGMERARRLGTRSGKRIGRPRARCNVADARAMLAEGKSQRVVAKIMGLSLGALQRALARTAAA